MFVLIPFPMGLDEKRLGRRPEPASELTGRWTERSSGRFFSVCCTKRATRSHY